ncbi:MAG: ABC transporter ATP-binding protein [Leptospirales bacterium]
MPKIQDKKVLLKIENLKAGFKTETESLYAIRGIDLQIKEGEILAVVGESGSGKTLTALSILQLLDPPAFIETGKIEFEGKNLVDLTETEMNSIRGAKISMIFQEPMTALNPVFTIGYQIVESILTHSDMNKKAAREKAVELLRTVGIPEPENRVYSYPYELSGGMRQRAMIAMALAVSPSLLIADEPTTALDVTIQAQILSLLKELRDRTQMAILLITHDLGIVSQMADNVAIMYAGQIIEYGPADKILTKSKHPYTQGLINSIPDYDSHKNKKTKKLHAIPGQVPSLGNIPKGCAFRNRCEYAESRCEHEIEFKKTKDSMYRCIR